MIVFAILGLLIGLLFMFVRQKLSALESRVNLLTDTVQTMAGFTRVEEDEEEDEDEDEDEEEEEEEEEGGAGYFTRVENVTDTIGRMEKEEKGAGGSGYFTRVENGTDTIRMEKEDMKVVSDDEVDVVDVVELNEDNEVKKINLEGPDYDSLSLKELKDKVTDLGGPKLRTKKELLDFLKNKI